MNMVEKADDQKHFSWCCFLKPPLMPIVVTLIPFSAFFFFFFLLSSHGFIFSLLITITVLSISSTVLLFHKYPKEKTWVCLAEVSVGEENPKPQAPDHGESATRPCDDALEEAEMTDLPSDTESNTATVESEAFELDWVSSNRRACNNVSSWLDDDHYDGGGNGDDDGDDMDGLIEIALMKNGPNGLCDDQNVNTKKHTNLQKLWVENDGGEGEEEIDYVNIEEENLIEIDISIGSIKRSTAEI